MQIEIAEEKSVSYLGDQTQANVNLEIDDPVADSKQNSTIPTVAVVKEKNITNGIPEIV